MSEIRIRPEQLAGALRGEAVRVRGAMRTAALAAARHFAAYLADQCDERGITDRGLLKSSWRSMQDPGGGATTYSDAPYAGIIESGARPHRVGKRTRDMIALWAHRKLGLDPKRAMQAAYFIGKKIEREGQKPTYMVRDAMPLARAYYGHEITRVLGGRR